MAPRARVLVVDDHEKNLVATRAVLEPLGSEIVCVQSGAQALKALLKEEFAVILLDVQMPEMDGIETAALIKARERTRHIPILFMTASANDTAWALEGYQHGAVDYLVKPLEPAVLRAKVSVFVELWRRGKAVEEHAQRLEEALRSEDEALKTAEFEQQLVGIVSHDIRSPLSAVKATAAALLSSTLKDSSQERALRRICRGANRIEQLTNLLLDFTRARVGGGISVSPRPTDMREICRQVVDETQAGHPGRRVELEFDDGDGIGIWDPARLQQLLANLIDNAFKYGLESEPVRLTARLCGDRPQLFVQNHGEPIKRDLLPTLFEPFSRGKQTEATVKVSLGLGLYIVRAIAEAHGGSVSVSSSYEEGTTFCISLPRHCHTEVEPSTQTRA